MRSGFILTVLLLIASLGSSALTPAAASTIRLEIGGGQIDVMFWDGKLDLPKPRIIGWVSLAACAVTDYYARLPVRHLRVLVVPVQGRSGVVSGTTFGAKGAFIKVLVGEHASEAELRDDWVLTHEMVHLALPSVGEEHHWIEEGIATYVEPIARVESGNLGPKKIWGDLIDGLPKGLPKAGDEGLDHTHSWGRTYWGGALFCTLADVEIRERTGNRRGLQDALRGIVAGGGNIEVDWPLTQALKVGDQAAGVSVLTELYDQMKATPVTPDLPALWKKLGVGKHGDEVVFDDGAPLESIRLAITAIPPADSAQCSPIPQPER